MNNRLSMFLLGATLALGLTLAASIIAHAAKVIKNDNAIRVKGFSEVAVQADRAHWAISVQARDNDMKVAYQIMDSSLRKVTEKLKALGFSEPEIKSGAASITEERAIDEKGNRTNRIELFRITQRVTVATANVALVELASMAITELIKDGINLSCDHPEYTISTLEELKLDLLGKATRNGYDRAMVMAKNSGGSAGRLKSAAQGIFQIVPVNSTDVSDSGSYDTSTRDKTIKAVVTLEFEVVK